MRYANEPSTMAGPVTAAHLACRGSRRRPPAAFAASITTSQASWTQPRASPRTGSPAQGANTRTRFRCWHPGDGRRRTVSVRPMRDRLRELGRLAIGPALGLPVPVLLRTRAGVQRRWASVPVPYRVPPAGGLVRLRTVAGDPATWRDLAWLGCQFVVGLGCFVLAAGLWLGAIECATAPALRALLPELTSLDPAVLEWTGRSGPLTWALTPVGG